LWLWFGAAAGSVVLVVVTAPAAVAQEEVTVEPSWEGAPWVPQVQKILNVTAQMGLACCVFSLLIGGAALGLGRVVGSYQAGQRGLQLILGGGGGSLVVVSAASIISWLVG
jgi:hypothetical protein